MKAVRDFFIPDNYVDGISGDAYEQAKPVIYAFDALARLTYHSVYVIDYYRKNFLYVSDNPLFLCALQPQEVKERGYAFYFDHVPEDELDMLLEINRAGFAFFSRTPVEDRIRLSISYDFHILNRNNRILINHKQTPIMLAGNGNIWLAACIVSPASRHTAGNVEAFMAGKGVSWRYSFVSRKWEQKENPALKDREREIIMLASQGLTMNEIAGELHITPSAVKYHKKNLFERLDVKNISEALSVVSNGKMM